MFKSARIKLTIYYLVIIMIISGVFSLFIYTRVNFQLKRSLTNIERRFNTERVPPPLHSLLDQDLKNAQKSLLFLLIYTNGVILFFSATAGYFLAGKTLKPIEKAMKKQKTFIADASHELRTPLTALKTSMEVDLRTKKLSKQTKEILKSNLSDVNNLNSLTNNLLRLAKQDDNSNNLKLKTTKIADVVNKALKSIDPLAKQKKIKVRISPEPKNQTVRGDSDLLTELLIILLDNAIKYTPKKGSVLVATQTTKKYLILKIKDTGIGISKQHIPHIFDRFYRVDVSRSKQMGFGLGLSLAKKIITQHQGSISVKSEIRHGSTFTLRLPLS
ncbi:HAMP domain-containing histidine kinase [Patescibacteria group bacterium]|nr:HAMP domain-containing histidine kinase [Patescibacteria group bacterium]MCG2702207.1 HAMP domain-containing histidine kinase [Candidatus Parcubacteria bacterium]MBU4264779.1 HAMP domain-containing histidine kinase [Patescibacteria group bacterium]MBU4390117.1 HAMP domain-containing histidine kinase [Patescibacteria group bacterium]MBU4396700.1 HAMP domain-containing histidine kinase [Patescibacteria group bacterium]